MRTEKIDQKDGKDAAKVRLLTCRALEAKKLEKAARHQVREAKAEYIMARRNHKHVRKVARLARQEAKLAAKAIGVKVKALLKAATRDDAATKVHPQADPRLRKTPVKARPPAAHAPPKKRAFPPLPAHLMRPGADGAKGVGPTTAGI